MNRYTVSLLLSLILLITTYSCKDDNSTSKSDIKTSFLSKDWQVITIPRTPENFIQEIKFPGNNIQLIAKNGAVIQEGEVSIDGDSIFIDERSYAQFSQESSDRLSLSFKEPHEINGGQIVFDLNFYSLEESIVSVDAVELEAMIQNSGWYFSEGMNKFPLSVSKAIDPNRESFSFVKKEGIMFLNLKSPGNPELEFPISVLRSTDMTILGFPAPGIENILLRDDTFQN